MQNDHFQSVMLQVVEKCSLIEVLCCWFNIVSCKLVICFPIKIIICNQSFQKVGVRFWQGRRMCWIKKKLSLVLLHQFIRINRTIPPRSYYYIIMVMLCYGAFNAISPCPFYGWQRYMVLSAGCKLKHYTVLPTRNSFTCSLSHALI